VVLGAAAVMELGVLAPLLGYLLWWCDNGLQCGDSSGRGSNPRYEPSNEMNVH
jgi:hypothetical protein